MPKTKLPIPETTESITRPIMLDITRQLMAITEITTASHIAFPGDAGEVIQLNSALSSRTGDDPNKFSHNDKIWVEVSEQEDMDRMAGEPVLMPGNLLIFEDPPLDTILKPVYKGMVATITIRYRASNKNLATRWRDGIKASFSQRRDINMHEITYHYGIPEEYLLILKEIHRLRELVDGYGDTFDTYFQQHRHPKITSITNLSGTASTWVMPETQDRIQGWFDFELPEDGSKEDKSATWTIGFSYKFRYDKVTHVVMEYPIVIHNQVLSTKYRPSKPIISYEDKIKSYSFATGALAPYEAGLESKAYSHRFGYSIPMFDEFMPEQTPPYSLRLMTILTTIDMTTPQLLLNLTDLGSRQFDPDILAYIVAERSHVVKQLGSLIHVNLYRNQFLIAPTPLAITKDLDVNLTVDPILRVQHHVRIGLLTNWRLLQGDALMRMQDHGRAVRLMLKTVDPSLESRKLLPPLIGDNFVFRGDILKAMDNMRPFDPKTGIQQMNTVQFLTVESSQIPA